MTVSIMSYVTLLVVKFIQETLKITTLFTFSILLINYIVILSVSCNYVAAYLIVHVEATLQRSQQPSGKGSVLSIHYMA